LLAGVLMMLPSVLSDGHETSVGVGVMFLIFGIVFPSRERESWPQLASESRTPDTGTSKSH
jgi:hypothetical protein